MGRPPPRLVVGEVVLAVGVVLALSLGACSSSASSSSSPAGADAPTGPPYGVSLVHLTLTDASRPTAAGSQTPARSTRTLETTVFFPDTDASVEGHFPLIVFAHGLTGNPDRHSDLAEAWAR